MDVDFLICMASFLISYSCVSVLGSGFGTLFESLCLFPYRLFVGPSVDLRAGQAWN